MSRRVTRFLALWLGLACLAPSAAHAQRVHVLAVTGLSGEPAYRLLFEAAASTLVDSARARWRVPDSSLVVLAEDMNGTRLRAKGRATKEGIAQSFGLIFGGLLSVLLVSRRVSRDFEAARDAAAALAEGRTPAVSRSRVAEAQEVEASLQRAAQHAVFGALRLQEGLPVGRDDA